MIWLNLLSVFTGLTLGSVYAVLFYRSNCSCSGEQKIRRLGAFLLRYILLFLSFWLLFYVIRLNIYFGVAGFFVAYWIVLLKMTCRSKMKDHNES